MLQIKHVWFDFSETIAARDDERHSNIKYATFADLKGEEQNIELEKEYDELFIKYGHSNSNVFAQEFGKGADFWPDAIAKEASNGLYSLAEKSVPKVLHDLSHIVPVSVFSNIDSEKIMESLGINLSIFDHILSSAELVHPKPHEEGYLKMIELSGLPANEILYIGDIEEKDVIPAKRVGLKTGIIYNHSDNANYNFNNFQEILKLFENMKV
jgi:HAD superfamily hydrolase (TIGR01549 family)